jgi:GNAT superfamily N-acetyltransferase
MGTVDPDETQVMAVGAELVWPLRLAVLRPGSPPEAVVYERDDAPGAVHAAAYLDGAIVGVGSAMPEPHPRAPVEHDWRVRGMATREDRRSFGIGGAVLAFCETHARERGARRLWCNARIGAVDFYERHGWRVEGERFEIEPIGTHLLMSKELD